MSELSAVLAQLKADEAQLSLSTVDLAYLVTSRFTLQARGLGCLDQEAAHELYARVAEEVDPHTRNARKRATQSLEKLTQSRIITRIERGRAMRAADYDLSGLGQAIAEHYLEVRSLSDRDLRVLTGELRLQLSELSRRAEGARTRDDWEELQSSLQGPVRALSEGLDLRRRGLDRDQEAVKEQVGTLLDEEWADAAERCEDLLRQTSAILSELNDILVGESAALLDALEPLSRLAAESEHGALIQPGLRDARQRISSLTSWGHNRQEAWTDYLQSVQRFIRDIVRLDPHRATARRLGEALLEWEERPWFLVCAEASRYRVLEWRDLKPSVPEASRPAQSYDVAEGDVPVALVTALDAAVQERLLQGGQVRLSELIDELLEQVPADKRFGAIGHIVHALHQHAETVKTSAGDWVRLRSPYEIEDQMARAARGEPS